MSDIGPRIKERRAALQLSLAEVGQRCGVSKSTVMHWENGTAVKQEKLLPLAAALQTTVDYLIGLTDNPAADSRLTPTEANLYHQSSAAHVFNTLVEYEQLVDILTNDADRLIIIDGRVVSVDADLMKHVTESVGEFFRFMLWKEGLPKN